MWIIFTEYMGPFYIVPGGGWRNATVPHYNTPHIPGLGSGVGGDQDSVPISVKFSYQMSLLHKLKSVSKVFPSGFISVHRAIDQAVVVSCPHPAAGDWWSAQPVTH